MARVGWDLVVEVVPGYSRECSPEFEVMGVDVAISAILGHWS